MKGKSSIHRHAKSDATDDPLRWLQSLSEEELINWLRSAVWLNLTFPLTVPSSSRLAQEITDLANEGSKDFRIRVRKIIPILFREWGKFDAPEALDTLLLISGKIRCAAAEPVIMQIAMSRLEGRENDAKIRQRCLAVLSGFGANTRTLPVFKRFIGTIDYAATCYRALYSFDSSYAVTELAPLLTLFKEASKTERFSIVLLTLFQDFSESNAIVEILIGFLKRNDVTSFLDLLESVRSAQLLSPERLNELDAVKLQELLRLLLKRSDPDTLRSVPQLLKSIGIEILRLAGANGQEYFTFRLAAEINSASESSAYPKQIMRTSELTGDSIFELAAASEDIAESALKHDAEGAYAV